MVSLIQLFAFLLFIKAVTGYDPQTALTSVWLSGAAYCGKETYYSMNLGGAAQGFNVNLALFDAKSDLQGFTGVLTNKKQIFIALRGSSSIRNWIEDFEIKQIPYTSNNNACVGCKVHEGFYKSTMAIKDEALRSMRSLTRQYPNYDIIVTGHSYGAACAQLLALELIYNGFDNIAVYNFGQPRVGNRIFANYVETILPDKLWRFTHDKDIVPHVPTREPIEYLHSCREVFETNTGMLRLCSDYVGEDPKCADQYDLKETNVDDHLIYLKHNMSCEASTISKVRRSILERLLT